MAKQSTAPNKSQRDKPAELPQEVKEAISEIGGLDRLLNAIKPEEIEAESELHRILSDKTRLTILRVDNAICAHVSSKS